MAARVVRYRSGQGTLDAWLARQVPKTATTYKGPGVAMVTLVASTDVHYVDLKVDDDARADVDAALFERGYTVDSVEPWELLHDRLARDETRIKNRRADDAARAANDGKS